MSEAELAQATFKANGRRTRRKRNHFLGHSDFLITIQEGRVGWVELAFVVERERQKGEQIVNRRRGIAGARAGKKFQSAGLTGRGTARRKKGGAWGERRRERQFSKIKFQCRKSIERHQTKKNKKECRREPSLNRYGRVSTPHTNGGEKILNAG